MYNVYVFVHTRTRVGAESGSTYGDTSGEVPVTSWMAVEVEIAPVQVKEEGTSTMS